MEALQIESGSLGNQTRTEGLGDGCRGSKRHVAPVSQTRWMRHLVSGAESVWRMRDETLAWMLGMLMRCAESV